MVCNFSSQTLKVVYGNLLGKTEVHNVGPGCTKPILEDHDFIFTKVCDTSKEQCIKAWKVGTGVANIYNWGVDPISKRNLLVIKSYSLNGGWIAVEDYWKHLIPNLSDVSYQLIEEPKGTITRENSKTYRAFCQFDPIEITFRGRVSLPSTLFAILQTQWYITTPITKQTFPVYRLHGPVYNGSTFEVKAPWPGIRPGDQGVHIYVGAVLLEPYTHKPIPGTAAGFSNYWYPWVC